MKADYIEKDIEFKEVAADLDSCADRQGGCDNCPLLSPCRRGFNNLANKVRDSQLSGEARVKFEARFKKLHKQSVLEDFLR